MTQDLQHLNFMITLASVRIPDDSDHYSPCFLLMMQLDSTVGEVMSSPAITLTPEKTVLGNL